MKACPTSNMNRSRLWGFEVSHIIVSFGALTVSNIILGAFSMPLLLSWVAGLSTLCLLRVVSIGQKDGHLELAARFFCEPHVYLGHEFRRRDAQNV
jgi:hypothetical protein